VSSHAGHFHATLHASQIKNKQTVKPA